MGQSPSSKNYTENPNDHILVQGNADMKNGHVVPRVWTTQITKQAEKGDLILSVRAPVGDIGKTDYDVVLGRGVAAIKGNSFIFQLLTKMKINGYWTRFSTGSTFESINCDNIKNAQISIPSLREQEKIGGLFNEFDSLIALHQRKLNKLKKLKSAYLTEMFPDEGEHKPKRRFAGFTDDWEQRKFSEILAKSDGLRRGPFGSALKKEFFISSSEYTVYEQNNAIYNTWKTRYFITPEKFQELHKFQLMPGDFILSGAGTIGRIAQVPANITKGVFNQALIRIRINPEWMDKKFFLIWMQSENMQRKLTQANPGSAMTNLVPMSEIKKWEIIIPSKAEQNKIGEFIQKLNSLIALHQRKIDKLQKLKNAYLNEMFV